MKAMTINRPSNVIVIRSYEVDRNAFDEPARVNISEDLPNVEN